MLSRKLRRGYESFVEVICQNVIAVVVFHVLLEPVDAAEPGVVMQVFVFVVEIWRDLVRLLTAIGCRGVMLDPKHWDVDKSMKIPLWSLRI